MNHAILSLGIGEDWFQLESHVTFILLTEVGNWTGVGC